MSKSSHCKHLHHFIVPKSISCLHESHMCVVPNNMWNFARNIMTSRKMVSRFDDVTSRFTADNLNHYKDGYIKNHHDSAYCDDVTYHCFSSFRAIANHFMFRLYSAYSFCSLESNPLGISPITQRNFKIKLLSFNPHRTSPC